MISKEKKQEYNRKYREKKKENEKKKEEVKEELVEENNNEYEDVILDEEAINKMIDERAEEKARIFFLNGQKKTEQKIQIPNITVPPIMKTLSIQATQTAIQYAIPLLIAGLVERYISSKNTSKPSLQNTNPLEGFTWK